MRRTLYPVCSGAGRQSQYPAALVRTICLGASPGLRTAGEAAIPGEGARGKKRGVDNAGSGGLGDVAAFRREEQK